MKAEYRVGYDKMMTDMEVLEAERALLPMIADEISSMLRMVIQDKRAGFSAISGTAQYRRIVLNTSLREAIESTEIIREMEDRMSGGLAA